MSRKLRVAPFPIGQIKNNIIRRTLMIVMFIPIILISLPIGWIIDSLRFIIVILHNVIYLPKTLVESCKESWDKPTDRKWKIFTIIGEDDD